MPTTRQAFLESLSDSEDESAVALCMPVPLRPPMKALTDDSSLQEEYEAAQQRYAMSAAVALVHVGEAPLTYVRCYKESRREALIAKHLGASATLPSTVVVAVAMSKREQLPPVGARGRKTEFLRRCREALKLLKPDAETDIKKLGVEEQRAIAAALDARLCKLCAEPASTEPATDPMCERCTRLHTCTYCGRGDLEDGLTQVYPHHEIKRKRCNHGDCLAMCAVVSVKRRRL
jgi:hypothetical protein